MGTADGLPNRVVTGIAIDKKTGDVWLSTFGGISRYSGGTFQNFASLTTGLANDIVYGVAVQDDFLWAATTAGISRMNLRTGEWSIFSEKTAPMTEPWAYGIAVGAARSTSRYGAGGCWSTMCGRLLETLHRPGWRDGDRAVQEVGLIHIIVSGMPYNHDIKMFWASTYFG